MIRLDKFLADMGIGTRQEVKKYMKQGRVTVDGEITKKPETKINTDKSKVCFDGREVAYAEYEYYMLNKPAGYISATMDDRDPTVLDLIYEDFAYSLFPVGRLDKDTEGLLLLTNDGALAHNLLSPKKHVDKEYYVELSKEYRDEDVLKLESGIILNEEEINEKLEKDTTNYVCINTSKETVSLAYSDAFPYLYERKEVYNRFKEIENEATSELIKTKEKKINNKAKIKIVECFKMAFQSFKRKKNRFFALVILSILSLYLFSLGWLFSTINIPNIVANKSNDLDLPISYICKKDDNMWYNSKLVFDKEVVDELENKYNQTFGYSTNFSLNYVNPSVNSSSVFAMNYFTGVIEIDDIKDLGFEVNGKSTSGLDEIIITDYYYPCK